MILKPLLPAILLALIMSVIVAVLAAGRGSGATLAIAVGLYVLQVAFAMVRINAPFWMATTTASGAEDDLLASCVWSNALLAALVYAWGATAMFAIYSISGLVWRHWWEYGAGMSVLAVAILLYALTLGAGNAALRKPRALNILIALTVVQAVAMAVALLYLLSSGKLHTLRHDWAANYVFVAGSAMLLFLSMTAVATYRRLARRGAGARTAPQR